MVSSATFKPWSFLSFFFGRLLGVQFIPRTLLYEVHTYLVVVYEHAAFSREHGEHNHRGYCSDLPQEAHTSCLLHRTTPPALGGLNGDLGQRGNKTERKRKGRQPKLIRRPSTEYQYTRPEPERHKNGDIQANSGMSTLPLVVLQVLRTPYPVSFRTRAAPTRTPMLRESDGRHRSTRRRDQMLCHRTPCLCIASCWNVIDSRFIVLAWLTRCRF
ncbi:hypothetical protein V8C42DRAFT_196425 [Trichoderma barbatum]